MNKFSNKTKINRSDIILLGDTVNIVFYLILEHVIKKIVFLPKAKYFSIEFKNNKTT